MTERKSRDERVDEKIRCDACPVMCYIADGKSGAWTVMPMTPGSWFDWTRWWSCNAELMKAAVLYRF